MIKKDFPKISIITPSFNQGQYIEQTIVSVLEQNYPNLEYIIVDGGSTDNTIDVLRKYEKHITSWVSEKDKGQSDAINKGMKQVSGEIVNWLNSDDYYMPGALHHIASRFSDPNITAYCGRSRVFSEKTEKTSQGTDIYQGNLAKTIGWARIDQPETFFRKVVWNKIGMLNESFHYVMDKEWWVRYLLNYGLSGILQDDKVLVNFRIHGQSKTGSQLKKFEEETTDLFYSLSQQTSVGNEECFFDFQAKKRLLHGYPPIASDFMKEIMNYYFLHGMLEAYAQNDYQKARNMALRVSKSQLHKDDKSEYENIVRRMKILPVGIKKLYNKLF